MKCPSPGDWDLLAMEMLEDAAAGQMLAHARSCPACRARLQAARREHVDRVRAYEVFDCDHDELREQLMAALPADLPQPDRTGWLARAGRRLGGFAMSLNKSTARRAAAILVPAACIVIAAAIFLVPRQSAFAAALERMRQASTIVARFEAFMGGAEEPTVEGKMYLSDEHGMFFDMGMDGTQAMRMYHPPEGPVIVVQPAFNAVIRMHGEAGSMDGVQQPRPDEFIRKFLEMTGDADRLLGRSEIDGRECQGFEVSGEKLGLGFGASPESEAADAAARSAVRLWVDVATNLPVRMDVDAYVRAAQSRMLAVYDQFEWDVPLEAALFEPEVPEDAAEIDIDIPPPTEQTLLNGLRLFADAAGHYPAALDPTSVGAELSMALLRSGRMQINPADPRSFLSRELMQDTMTVTMACGFVQKLAADGHEPEYFGDVVTPEDVDEVLLHWRLDDGRMRVIHGDLRAESVPATD